MSVNVWNIKDMFNTSSVMGSHKSSSWTSAATDYNSMSDSQFLFGSQFCPENSQSTSTPLEFRPCKSSQQNSQDSEPSIFAKYQSKPQLFSEDEKERGSLNFPAGRFKSALEQFEDKKKKIKEKHDSEVLSSFIWNTKENLQKLQSSLDKFEDILKSMLDGLSNLAKNMQETSQSHYELVQNVLKDKGEMEQTLLGVKKMLEDNNVEFSDLKSSQRLLKKSLEQLMAQQNEQHSKLCEQLGHLQLPSLLADLQAFISAPRTPSHIKDSAAQTSPDMLSTNHSPTSQLNAPPGSKFTSTVGASGGKENVSKQQRRGILTTSQDDNNTLCTCHSGPAAPEDGREGCWLLTQEPYQATPVRRVIKRNNQAKGLCAVRHAPLTCSHADSGLMQTHAQNHEKLATVHKVQSKNTGSRVKKGRFQKCNRRKRQYSSKKGPHSKYIATHLKQKEIRKECAESERLQRSYQDSVNQENTSIISQQNPHWIQNRMAEKSKLLFQSDEKVQHVPNQWEMSGVKKRVDISSISNNSFWACSSPESSLSQNQMGWLTLSENLSPTCAASALQKTTTRCPLFFDSDYSD
ncbi:interactor of HORMAD1 protein 1 [Heteronotia binoei]|uniref:interactor of HORMAD1 protein 1 n=1 Tax=Heteronotia binoei TaxID=13085 RepID=UPI002931BBD1|nr:interactor of HORMAD1 protein 1 [Heteronotia binoei]